MPVKIHTESIMKNNSKDTEVDTSVDEEKRAALKKLGKRAAYMSPVVLSMLTTSKKSAASFTPPPPP